MKFDCELIQDLLPLYEEDLCSPASRRAVEDHLRECGCCRRLASPLPIEPPTPTPAADRAVKKSMRKVKRRWLASLLAAMLAFPMLLLGFNQCQGYGPCFTNLDELCTAWQFLHALETENWDKAAQMHDFATDYQHIMEALANPACFTGQEYEQTRADVGWVADLTEAEFEAEMTRRYTSDLCTLTDSVTFDCTGFRSVGQYNPAQGGWYVVFAVTVTQDGKTTNTTIQIDVTDGKIQSANLSHTPGIQWLDDIDRILYPSAHAGY